MAWEYMNQSPPPRRPGSGNNGDGIWWVFIILGLVFAWPVGLILLFIRMAKNKKTDARRNTSPTPQQQNYKAPSVIYAPPATGNQASPYNTGTSAPEIKASAKKKSKKSLLPLVLMILSGIFLVAGITVFAETLDLLLWVGSLESYMYMDLFSSVGYVIAAVVLFFSGRSLQKKEKRYSKYANFVGKEKKISIEALAAAIPASVDSACKDLQAMIDKGYFGESA